jgi:hypothetical protein
MQVGANIIGMYPSTSLFIAVGQLAIVILVLFSYPLQILPCRNCLDKVFHAGDSQAVSKPSLRGDDEDEDGEVDDEFHTPADMTPFKHTVLTAAIVSCGFVTAYLVDDLKLGASLLDPDRGMTLTC